MFMKPEELKKLVMEYIRKESPEFADSEPIITDEIQSVNRDVAKKLGIKISKAVPQTFKTFTFQKMVTAEGGAKIPIVSSVTIDENGNIIRSTGN